MGSELPTPERPHRGTQYVWLAGLGVTLAVLLIIAVIVLYLVG